VRLPDRRHRSQTLRVAARTVDWRNGERFERDTLVEIQAEQWRHPRTGRWRWVWSAREQSRLGWQTSSSPRQAIRDAVIVPAGTRPRWLTEAVRVARDLARDR
jgi:hypothetical protein